MSTLYVVATPIGNLSDMTPRMEQALREADLVAAEDTRVTLKLLNHLGIAKPMISCHRHNEEDRTGPIIERMLSEELTVALTCDAGTPAISDPGSLLVKAAWDNGIRVVPISGPSAVITALSVSGFDTREFAFYGFLPREKKALREKLGRIRSAGIRIAVIFESPFRITDLVSEIAACWGGTNICVCCDLTKKYECIIRGSASDVLEKLKENPNTEKGEYCVVAEVPEAESEKEEAALSAELSILQYMLDGESLSAACKKAQETYPRNEVYRAKLKIKDRFEED